MLGRRSHPSTPLGVRRSGLRDRRENRPLRLDEEKAGRPLGVEVWPSVVGPHGHNAVVILTPEKRAALVAELTHVDASATYYALTLTATEDGRIQTQTQTRWAGPGSKRMWEMRVPSLVDPEKMRSAWETIGQTSVVVGSAATMALFARIGGNAVVEASLFSRWFRRLLEPRECVPNRFGEEIRTVESVGTAQLKHAPAKKLRMDVLRRDDFRCRVCGRSPDDYVDLELHVHHVRPWGEGGLTEESNLLTLCHTCHTGLDPHFELRLLGKIPDGVVSSPGLSALSEQRREFDAAVQRYRDLVKTRLDVV